MVFRAWNNKEKKWELGYELPKLGGFSMIGETMIFGEYNRLLNQFSLKDLDQLMISQYIGLEDNFGNMIYGGDIFERKTGSIKYEVRYEDCQWLGFDLENKYPPNPMGKWLNETYPEFKVIGNIYELCKGSKEVN